MGIDEECKKMIKMQSKIGVIACDIGVAVCQFFKIEDDSRQIDIANEIMYMSADMVNFGTPEKYYGYAKTLSQLEESLEKNQRKILKQAELNLEENKSIFKKASLRALVKEKKEALKVVESLKKTIDELADLVANEDEPGR